MVEKAHCQALVPSQQTAVHLFFESAQNLFEKTLTKTTQWLNSRKVVVPRAFHFEFSEIVANSATNVVALALTHLQQKGLLHYKA